MPPRFSERVGAVTPARVVQLETISYELRHSLWNVLIDHLDGPGAGCWLAAATVVARRFRKFPVDELPSRFECRDWLKKYFYSLDWATSYDLIEFITDRINEIVYGEFASEYRRDCRPDLARDFNAVLESELSGYRFIAGVLSPIADRAEVEEVERAIAAASTHGLLGAHDHIKTALVLLAKKPDPDYRNSIKESISAIESVVRKITGSDSAGLADALEQLDRAAQIHGALKASLKRLYGYTSDDDGIRHAILDQSSVGFDEAKFMAVACSAFVNFLISKSAAAGLLK